MTLRHERRVVIKADPESRKVVERILRHRAVNRSLGRTDENCWCGPTVGPQGEQVHDLDRDPATLVQSYIEVPSRRNRKLLRRLARSLGAN